MVKRLFTMAILTVAGLSAVAQDAPLWLRDVAISPDGNTVAFTFKGDIYTVPYSGGQARRLTTSPAYDSRPSWRPDGKQIVFRSNREGSDDIYIMNATGGTPRRLTTHSGQETPLAWVDNSTLLFQANVQPARSAIQGPFQSQTWTINVDSVSPRPHQAMSINVLAASYGPDGRILYQDRKGFENIYRKHERSSGTSDIWLVSPDGAYNKLTSFEGHDLNPVWKKGTDSFYYISEKDGTLNVYERSVDGKNERQLTHFADHPVRSLTASDSGKLAFSWDGEVYTLTPGGDPVKLNIAIATDDYDNDRVKRYITNGASNIAVSPTGNEVAFVVRGDIYVTNTKYKTTKRITNTPAQERSVDFAPDGRTLVYDSDRDGQWKLYVSRIVNDDEKEFAYATDLAEELLYSSNAPAQQPDFSPDGKKVAFLEDRTTLRVIDVDSKKVNTALDGDYNYSYTDGDISFQWSPDSRWLLCDYIGIGGWNNSDIALVAADGSQVVDLTESGYADYNPQWVLDGKGITYQTGKYGMKSHGSWGNETDVILMVLDTETWDNFGLSEEDAAIAKKERERADSISEATKPKPGKKDKKKDKQEAKEEKPEVKPLDFDLENRRYRQQRLTTMSGRLGGNYLSPEGDKFYYVAASPEGKTNLLCRDMREGSTKILAGDINGGFVADQKGENLYFIGSNGLSKLTLANGERKPIEFEAIYERHPSLERDYIYGHMWQQVKDKFYDANLHGVDWAGYGSHYRRFLPYIDNNRDFADMLSEILGELNASHTGSGTGSGYASLPTATLGAFFDPDYDGDGLKVAEVLPRSPLASKKADIKPGDIILAINGNKIEAEKDYYPLLEGLAGRKTALTIKRAAGGKTDDIVVKPLGGENDLLYQRWVERNEAIVDSVSGGRVAYVHVQGMDSPSFRTVYDRLLGKYRNHAAVIVDTRYNGGGWLHNDIAQLLSGKEYVRFTPRDKYIGSEPFSQWTKPSVMLVNESNYSDAHGTPFVYQTLGIGDIVGAPVPGTMTAVWWETQIDPAIYFGIPQVTSRAMDGTVLENHQLTPDVIIYNNPADVQKGQDDQLIGATRHLLKQLDEK